MDRFTITRFGYLIIGALLLACLYAGPVLASNWWYAEVGATRTRINVVNTDFNPILPRLKLGVFLTPQIMLEAHYAGSGDDKVANTRMDVESITAAYLRLDSGIRGDMRAYVLLGGAESKLKVTGSGGSTGGTDNYSDFSWGIGIEDRVWTKHTLLTLEYAEYYNHDEVIISGVSLGFKFEY